jgi:hypothetical protein
LFAINCISNERNEILKTIICFSIMFDIIHSHSISFKCKSKAIIVGSEKFLLIFNQKGQIWLEKTIFNLINLIKHNKNLKSNHRWKKSET